MVGRAEVERRRAVLEATLTRARSTNLDSETQSDLARYLCVLVSGFVEKAVAELLVAYSSASGSPALQSYVRNSLGRLKNVNRNRLLDLMGAFDPTWRSDYEAFLVDERQAALDSVVALRNDIAHGGGAGITLARLAGYWDAVQQIVDHLENKLDPLASSPTWPSRRRRGQR